MTSSLENHPEDTATPQPLCDEPEFAELLTGLVADTAPTLFAVVQEYGSRIDARVAAWGLAFEDHAEVVAVDRTLHMRLRRPENALRRFTVRPHVRTRLVWFDPAARTHPDDRTD
ncbi:hypothetical protein CEP50_15875 [Actinopolyspora mortivallis]|uniref:Uncharacterized protein n=2 Tax=Actinopolyspora mortivallis TaxID=33906 RepID=A0A2T0GTD4_ACTMO|nr:hypothetical protein CEP50_15875 [Actinopolyspora mortivallis]